MKMVSFANCFYRLYSIIYIAV